MVKDRQKSTSSKVQQSSIDEENETQPDSNTTSKPKRVRTGCLTCRERHLKCDEGHPICLNCKKSSRACKRGVRLNFIDTKCQRPPHLLPQTHDFRVEFEDNSVAIASEYQGGIERYANQDSARKRRRITPPDSIYDFSQVSNAVMSTPHIPQGFQTYQNTNQIYTDTGPHVFDDSQNLMNQSYAHRESYDQQMMTPQEPESPGLPLTNREEVLYMQVFVEEVALWMDSMDKHKHFSRILPFQALKEPMLKYALLACGVRHLTLVNTAYPEEHALTYYAESNKLLLKSLQNPNRDTVLCATTAAILNVYEIMSEKALQRMNHIAGARALIKECRWDGSTEGVGGACFWLNVGMELFSCLHFNWGVAWDPDTWNVDMSMSMQPQAGNEEDWTHKMLWILAKVTNFRSSMPRFQEQTLHAEQVRLNNRLQTWLGLKQFCDKWAKCVPPTMHAIAVVPSYLTRLTSAFPEVWFIKRTSIVGRLFWHTANVLLATVHPMAPYTHGQDPSVSSNPQLATEMAQMRLEHARQICGIVKHAKDRGVASASIRCLAVAAEYLNNQREQEEALTMFERIKTETGWRIAFINDELKEKWGWSAGVDQFGGQQSAFFSPTGHAPSLPAIPQQRQKPPSGIINPLYKHADFSSQNPPYAGSYVPPANNHFLTHHGQGNGELYGYRGLTTL